MCVYMRTHSQNVALGQHSYLWGKTGFVQVWKVELCYFWRLLSA